MMMLALKKFLLLTTALTMVMPCEAKADTVVVDSQKTLTSLNSIYQNAGGGIAIRTGAALTFSDGDGLFQLPRSIGKKRDN